MYYMPIEKEVVVDNIRAVKVAHYHLVKLKKELEKHLDFSEYYESQDYANGYREYRTPNKSDVTRQCDVIRKLLLEIKKTYK